jgi:hypothetical protein
MKKTALVLVFFLAGCAGLESSDHMIQSPTDGETISASDWTILVTTPINFSVDQIQFFANSNLIMTVNGNGTMSNFSCDWPVGSYGYTNGQTVVISVSVWPTLPTESITNDSVTVTIKNN